MGRFMPGFTVFCRFSVAKWAMVLGLFCAVAQPARPDVALFMEDPYGAFGGMNPTGHAAVYLSRVCSQTPTRLRRCGPGESGVMISRYHRVAGYDWMAIPLTPYLFAVEEPADVPLFVDAQTVAQL